MADRTPLDLLTELMAQTPQRCTYAEARHAATDNERVLVRNGHVEQVENESSDGIGVRVRVGGGWGFAATRQATFAGAEHAPARALAIAESQPATPAAPLAPVQPAQGHWSSGFDTDPSTSRSRTSSSCSSPPMPRCAATRGSCARRPTAPGGGCAARSPRPTAPPVSSSASSAARRSRRSRARTCR